MVKKMRCLFCGYSGINIDCCYHYYGQFSSRAFWRCKQDPFQSFTKKAEERQTRKVFEKYLQAAFENANIFVTQQWQAA